MSEPLKGMKRIFTFVLAMLLLVGAISCTPKEPADTETTADTTEPVSVRTLTVAQDGEGIDVVYGKEKSLAHMAALDLASDLGKLSRTADFAAEIVWGEPNPDKVEILVGDTGYAESTQAMSEVGYGEGLVRVVGNKIVVAALDSLSLEEAIRGLLLAVKETRDENGNMTLSSEFTYSVTGNPTVAALPRMDSAYPEIIDTGDGCYLLSFEDVEKAQADAYVTALTQQNFNPYTTNTLESNFYTTLTNDKQIVNVAYLGNEKRACVLIEPKDKTALPKLESENVYTPVDGIETTFTQIGLAYATETQIAEYYTSGMSYVMHLADDSFIVIDGGYDNQANADNLYNVMKKQAKDPENIVIAAWILTHAHSDHVELLPKFGKSYGDKVTVERFIYNFPSVEQMSTYAHSDSRSKAESAIKTYFKSAERIKAHAGQVFHIRNAKVEILYTIEIGAGLLEKDYNNTSLVFTLETENTKILMLGDYSEDAKTLMSLYTAETLKSDVMQVGHHGVSGQSMVLPTIVAPEYALWPVIALQFKAYYASGAPQTDLTVQSFNNYFVNVMDAEKVFVAGDNITVATLNKGAITVNAHDSITEYLQ